MGLLTHAIETAANCGVVQASPKLTAFVDNMASMNLDRHALALANLTPVGETYAYYDRSVTTDTGYGESDGYISADDMVPVIMTQEKFDRDTAMHQDVITRLRTARSLVQPKVS